MRIANLKFLLLFAVSLALLSGLAGASCGTLPSAISGLITACIPANVLNLQSTATPLGFQQAFNALPFNALAGNFVVYNSLSGSLMPAWVESNSLVWVNLGTNTIGATSNAIDVYYFGLGSSSTNFFVSGNDVGESPNLSASYGQYDNGWQVFNTLYQDFAGTSLPSGWVNNAVTINNGITTGAVSNIITSTAVYGLSSNVLEFYGNVISGTNSNNGAGYTGAIAWALGSSSSVIWGGYSGASYCNSALACGATSSAGTPAVETTLHGLTTNAVYSMYWPTSSSASFQVNYGTNALITTEVPSAQLPVGIAQNTADHQFISWFRIRAYPPSGVMPTVQYGSAQAPSSVTLSVSPNPASYGTQVQITASPTPNTDGSNIIFQGSTVLTGTGAITYNALGTPIAMSNALAPGTYTVNGCDTTLNTCAYSTILTVNKATPTNTLTSCTSSTLPFTCTTTATISTLSNQEQISLYLGSNLIGSNVLSVSDTESNTIYDYAYTANSPGNGNYLPTSLTASFYGYIPLVFQNVTGSALTTRSIAPPQNTIFSTYYPIKLTATNAANVLFNLTSSVNAGANVLIEPNALNVTWVPLSNSVTGNYVYSLKESQYANSVTIGANVNLLNMLDMNGALTFNTLCSPVIQYFPNCAVFPFASNVFTVKPTVWKILSDAVGNQHSNGTALANDMEQFSNANQTISLANNVVLTYGQFTPAIAFAINAVNNPSVQSSIAQTQFKFFAQNTHPSSPYTREIGTFNAFSLISGALLSNAINVTVTQTDLLNNYTISNVSTVQSANNFQLYMPASNYVTPSITQSQLSAVLTKKNFFATLNNYCSATITGSSYRNFNIYVPDTTNASLYTFSVYSGFQTGAIGDFIKLMYGNTNASAIAVQQYQIQNNPFALALINGAAYSFRLYNSKCALVYATNYSIWTSPININIPVNTSVPKLSIPNATAKCSLTFNAVNAFSTLACTGSDTTNLVDAWKIKVINASGIGGWNTITTNSISGTSGFSWTYSPVSNVSSILVQVTAYISGYQGASIPFVFQFNNAFRSGFGSSANGFIILFLLLIGVGIGAGTGRGGGESARHMMSTTLWIEAFMVFLIWGFGLATFLPTVIIIGVMLAMIAFGVVINRYENNPYFGG